MPVTTNQPVRRLFPVYILVDASGSVNEDGKWKIIDELLTQFLKHLKDSPDPDFEIVFSLLLMQGGGVAVEYESSPIEKIEIRDLVAGGVSNYSIGLEKLAELLDRAKFPKSAHRPCILLIGDGHVDAEYQSALEKCLKKQNFSNSTRIVVEIGNDFEPSALRKFLSSPNNFFSVMDIASMPFFYMRLASSVSNQVTQSRSRRILAEQA